MVQYQLNKPYKPHHSLVYVLYYCLPVLYHIYVCHFIQKPVIFCTIYTAMNASLL
jgi:hypothetical protein